MEKKFSMCLHDQVKLNDELAPPEYIWRSITPGSLGFVYGPPKSGKTTFCENLGMSIAFGLKEFFGNKIESEEPKKVLFISMEEYWRARIERNKKQIDSIDVPEECKTNYQVVTDEFPRFFSNNAELKDCLQRIIQETEPCVVFIDSMTRMATKDIEDSTVSGAISGILRELANENEVSIVVVHHTHKLNGNAITIDSLAGSRVLAQEADFMIGINKTTTGNRYYKEVAMRYGQEKEDVTLFEISENQWLLPIEDMPEYQVLALTDRRRNPDNRSKVIAEMQRQYKENATISTPELVKNLEPEIGKSQVYNYLENLQKEGIISRDRGKIQLIS